MHLFLLSYLWLLTQIIKENVKTGKVPRRHIYTEHSVKRLLSRIPKPQLFSVNEEILSVGVYFLPVI